MALELVTLDNFRDKLPGWDPLNHDRQLFAIVDMGSNGIRFSITDLSPPKTRLLETVYKERASISLYDDLNSSKKSPPTFSKSTIKEVSDVVHRFQKIAEDLYSVPTANFTIMATEAMRKAGNASAMIRGIGTTVFVLEPQVEALFGAAMGSRSAFHKIDKGGLFFDLGGGSVQMSWINTAKPNYEITAAQTGKSLPFGAARLRNILESKDVDMRTTEIKALQSGMSLALAELCNQFPDLQEARDGEGVDILMCGGGFRGYGSMLLHTDEVSPYPIANVANYSVSGSRFRDTQSLLDLNANYKGKIFGVSKRRRKQFSAINTVVEALIAAVGNIRMVTFCAGSNRQGSLMMKLPPQIRESDPSESLMYLNPRFYECQADEEYSFFVKAVSESLRSALPSGAGFDPTNTIFGLGLQNYLVSHLWDNLGNDEAGNAALALHHATSQFPDIPGLSHIGRAALAITLVARWDNQLGPADKLVLDNLKKVLNRADPNGAFWHVYLGAVARIIAMVAPKRPTEAKDIAYLSGAMLFKAEFKDALQIADGFNLQIKIKDSESLGLDYDDLRDIISATREEKNAQGFKAIETTFTSG
ncbi:retrograde regulation protein 2 [Ceratocystis pirilliformis]|uniref:Retrograde regulation protein 2 n=1 Tax=Ceratocystis pirilliformis TaxID=259994 RepID=A0ABR3Z2D1_9PEZI